MLSWYYLTMLYLHNCVHDARLTAIIRSHQPMVEQHVSLNLPPFVSKYSVRIDLTISLNCKFKISKFLISCKLNISSIFLFNISNI